MPAVTVLTAVYGGYDTLKPTLPQTVPVEWVCVTDDPALADDPRGWTIVVEPRDGHPNRAAKHPKMAPGRYTDAEASIWVDASFAVMSPTMAADLIAAVADVPQAQFGHPWRGCLYEEAEASLVLDKYAGEPIAAQAAAYRAAGHPEGWGLWATGVIARRHTAQVLDVGAAWLAEIDAWSFQDQVSEPHVLREAGLRPVSLPGWHMGNQWLSYQGSGRH